MTKKYEEIERLKMEVSMTAKKKHRKIRRGDSHRRFSRAILGSSIRSLNRDIVSSKVTSVITRSP